ncbi:GNAT family N-acetyltransferase [Roseibium aggregatum]|uniref:GNAT family N-acetyltransferase n=1 Tax=Roseibium aggregatum TaxID=187304 RepID=A0A939J4G4_9HYPH|nr:GNAT family N-acetyltransferase [Roseibium aggregatum]MBN9671160.1 GNAT family N-acetyltransferase [Roseibium aggregatum]
MPIDQTDPFAIFPVENRDDLEAVKVLFRAYVDWLGIDLSYQGFEEELASMPGKYAPPRGSLFLAKSGDGQVLGCVGLRPFGTEGSCEMKRLYVLPDGRGLGIGAALVERVVAAARNAGYRDMVLDTLPSMRGAIRLYQAAGFEETEAYYVTPIEETVFFRKVL